MLHMYRGTCSIACIVASITMTSSFSGWIDPDSLAEHSTMVSYSDGKTYDLIMSDEFNREGRTFKDGDDPTWTGNNVQLYRYLLLNSSHSL